MAAGLALVANYILLYLEKLANFKAGGKKKSFD